MSVKAAERGHYTGDQKVGTLGQNNLAIHQCFVLLTLCYLSIMHNGEKQEREGKTYLG